MSETQNESEFLAQIVQRNITGHLRHIFSDPVHAELLDALDVLLDQELGEIAHLIRQREAESRVTLLRAGGIAALRLAARDHEIQDNRPWVERWLNNRADEISEAANG